MALRPHKVSLCLERSSFLGHLLSLAGVVCFSAVAFLEFFKRDLDILAVYFDGEHRWLVLLLLGLSLIRLFPIRVLQFLFWSR